MPRLGDVHEMVARTDSPAVAMIEAGQVNLNVGICRGNHKHFGKTGHRLKIPTGYDVDRVLCKITG